MCSYRDSYGPLHIHMETHTSNEQHNDFERTDAPLHNETELHQEIARLHSTIEFLKKENGNLKQEISTLKKKLDLPQPTVSRQHIRSNSTPRKLNSSVQQEPRVNVINYAISNCVDASGNTTTRSIPLNGGFHWDKRLKDALDHPQINISFAQQFSYDFESMNLIGGEIFSLGKRNYQIVGIQPNRPKYCIVAVDYNILRNANYEITPYNLRTFSRRQILAIR